jgi:hypothetical protein
MKIILSRKGFDSSTGGIPSPILPSGRLLSLPIPVTKKGEVGIPYSDLRFGGQPISKIINDLYGNPSRKQFPYKEAHLDPDLDKERYDRKEGWRRVFGQQGGAQTYLKNRGVRKGDLFLFFGWFKHAKEGNGQLHYVRGAKNLHVIFGWLQVGDILEVKKDQPLDEFPTWLRYHSHIVNRNIYSKTANTIYMAPKHLTLEGLSVPAAGIFPCFKPSLQLTAPEEKSRSHWSLPKWLCRKQVHGNWACHVDHHLPFDSNGRRQEFVFEIPDNSQHAKQWLKGLFEECC